MKVFQDLFLYLDQRRSRAGTKPRLELLVGLPSYSDE